MYTSQQTRPARTFWWDREVRPESVELRAVVFDADSALTGVDCDEARDELIDSVMSLFVAGIWVSVVSAQPRALVQDLVRQLLGDGVVETIVTIDDLAQPDPDLPRRGELYRLALWEMGITARGALAVTGCDAGAASAAAAGLPVVGAGRPLSAAGCQQSHRRWWIAQTA